MVATRERIARIDAKLRREAAKAKDPAAALAILRHEAYFVRLKCENELSHRLYIESIFPVEDRYSGATIPWTFNHAQRHIEAVRTRYERKKRPFRAIILKSRRQGITTQFVGYGLEFVVRGVNRNRRSLIVAHKTDRAKEFLDWARTMRDKSRQRFTVKRDNASMIGFPIPINGHMEIDSAEADSPGRGGGYRFVHCTEVAFWGDNAKDQFNGIRQTIPDHPDTVIGLESTANGIGDFFYDFWMLALEGKSEYAPIFLPWFVDPLAKREITQAEERDIMGSLDADELWLVSKGVTAERLAWRRWAIVNLAGNDLLLFQQEYPGRWEEAFISTGRPAFAPNLVKRATELCTPPIAVGDMGLDAVFHPNAGAPMRIWKMPEHGRRYVIGADPCEGTGTDYASVHVMDEQGGDIVATWRARVMPFDFAAACYGVGKFYNFASLMPERRMGNAATLEKLRELGYPNMMRTPSFRKIVTLPSDDMLGWDSNSVTKDILVNGVRGMLAKTPELIRDVETCRELAAIQVDDKGKVGAPKGRNDDRMSSLGIAIQARKILYYGEDDEEKDGQEEPPPPSFEDRHWGRMTEVFSAAGKSSLMDEPNDDW